MASASRKNVHISIVEAPSSLSRAWLCSAIMFGTSFHASIFCSSLAFTPSLRTASRFRPHRLIHGNLKQNICRFGTLTSIHAASDREIAGSHESFESLGLSDDLIDVTEKMGWEYPTPVQQLSIPAILDMANNNDSTSDYDSDNNYLTSTGGHSSLWCEAPTGSGKTAGFALPLLQMLLHRKRPGSQHEQLHEQKPSSDQGFVSALILCPTRELAAQTGSVIERLVSNLPNKKHRSSISVEVVHGGVPIEPQVVRLAKRRTSNTGVDILVATPGRLVDVLRNKERVDPTMAALERRVLDAFEEKSAVKKSFRRRGGRSGRMASSLSLNDIQEMEIDRMDDDDGRGSLDEILHELDYLVLDEADRLLGGAFKEEMDELLSLFPQKKDIEFKSLLFSATFPEQVEVRVDRLLSRISPGVPLRVSTSAAMLQRVPDDGSEDGAFSSAPLSHRREKRLASTTPITAVASDVAPHIKQRAIRLNEKDRTQALRYLLTEHNDEWDRALVFVATRYAAEHVTRKLRRYEISAAELHGKLDQDARERRLNSFRSGKTRVLISTDLAARGIDVEGLPVVINYDLPRSTADFTHRTGRTGRAGKTGMAISFVTAKRESHFDFILRKELRGRNVEREVLPGFEPDESLWEIESMADQMSIPGAIHSEKGLVHDRMFGGVKGRRKSKKDKLREAAAKAVHNQDQ